MQIGISTSNWFGDFSEVNNEDPLVVLTFGRNETRIKASKLKDIFNKSDGKKFFYGYEEFCSGFASVNVDFLIVADSLEDATDVYRRYRSMKGDMTETSEGNLYKIGSIREIEIYEFNILNRFINVYS